MHNIRISRLFLLVLLFAGIAAGCSIYGNNNFQPAIQPPAKVTSPPPVITLEKGAIEDPDVYVDLKPFESALLKALMEQDKNKLQKWMTTPFLEGWWRADGSDAAPQDVLKIIYNDYLGAENRLEIVPNADLKALMGGTDPLSFPRSDAGVIKAVLTSGWGKDGRDEAILYIARQSDNSLHWQGFMYIKGGMSGTRLGGIQLYTNPANNFRFYLPAGYEVQESNPNSILIMAPGEGHPGEGRAAAFINIEPANGRTVEEITEQAKADAGPGFEIPPGTAMGLDKAMSITLTGLPGQDVNRQLFVVYKDRLYHILFVPDTPKVQAYKQMEDLYDMITNTFHFTD